MLLCEDFWVDHPFLYIIHTNGCIHFIGALTTVDESVDSAAGSQRDEL